MWPTRAAKAVHKPPLGKAAAWTRCSPGGGPTVVVVHFGPLQPLVCLDLTYWGHGMAIIQPHLAHGAHTGYQGCPQAPSGQSSCLDDLLSMTRTAQNCSSGPVKVPHFLKPPWEPCMSCERSMNELSSWPFKSETNLNPKVQPPVSIYGNALLKCRFSCNATLCRPIGILWPPPK